ncbi:hypothetical protein VTJ83DRAFT_6033 [Remersonia thermophila]|uniref:Galactose oxidase n=1 Tax=Remersonia thermophila TaxID=72144 RepID=A0ABR4D8L4_9PEZI
MAEAVTIAAPTHPLKLSLTRLSVPMPAGTPRPALARSHHTLTVLSNKAFIFGGIDASGTPCPPGIHTLTLPTSEATPNPPSTATEIASSSSSSSTTTTTLPGVQESTAPSTSSYFISYPPYALHDDATGELLLPCARSDHAACARGPDGRYLLIHGGRLAEGHGHQASHDDDGNNENEDDDGGSNRLWQWDASLLRWTRLPGMTQLGESMAAPRWGHWIFWDRDEADEMNPDGFVILIGGRPGGARSRKSESGGTDEPGGTETQAWMYDLHSGAWTALPALPARPLAAAYMGRRVYALSRAAEDGACAARTAVHFLDMRESAVQREKPGALVWTTVPANSRSHGRGRGQGQDQGPGPEPREGGALIPLTTGHGREYLVYLLGCSENPSGETRFHSDIWTLQLPARKHSIASAVDKLRGTFMPHRDTGEFRWAEAEIVPTEQGTGEEKAYPGPRAMFGADTCLNGRGVVLWGGINANGETESDGWLLRPAYGHADHERAE